jgi:hypothetical protein
MDLVAQASLSKYLLQRKLCSHTDEELASLPAFAFEQLPPADIDHVWHRLPDHLKIDKFCRCTRHWNLPSQRTHIDGPAPMIMNCYACATTHQVPTPVYVDKKRYFKFRQNSVLYAFNQTFERIVHS